MFYCDTHFIIYGTYRDSSYNSVAIFETAPIFLQSINQNRAETVVVKDTLSFINVKGVDPVTSSHCDSLVPPTFSDPTNANGREHSYTIDSTNILPAMLQSKRSVGVSPPY